MIDKAVPGLRLTCIVELRLGAAAVDDHRPLLLLRHGHAQGCHGAFVNKALETSLAQKPAIHTIFFHKLYYRMGGRKQIHSALRGGGVKNRNIRLAEEKVLSMQNCSLPVNVSLCFFIWSFNLNRSITQSLWEKNNAQLIHICQFSLQSS